MFLGILHVHWDQNNSSEIGRNGCQVRRIKRIDSEISSTYSERIKERYNKSLKEKFF